MVRRGQLDHLRLGFARPKNLQRRNHRFREIVCGDGGEQRAFTGGIHPAGEAKRVTQQRLSKSRLVKLGQAAIGSGFVGSDVAPGAGAKEQFVRTITIPVEHHDARAGLGQSPSEHWLALKVVGRRLGVDVGQPIASIGKQRRGCGRRPGLGLRVFLVNLVSMIRLGSVDDRACPAWPGDLDAELAGLASGKRPQRFIAREVTPTGHHFLRLFVRPTAYGDTRPDAARVAPGPTKRHRHPGCRRVIAVHQHVRVEATHDDILVAVVVEITQRNAVANVFRLKPPVCADLCKAQPAGVAIHHVRHGERREEENLFARLRHRQLAELGRALDSVKILRIKRMPVGNQQILQPVEVDVHECRAPSPLGGGHATVIRGLHVGVVAAVHEQRVAVNDRAVDELVDRLGERVGNADLRHLQQVLRAHHVGDKKIVVPVAVDVGEVHRHREIAAMP